MGLACLSGVYGEGKGIILMPYRTVILFHGALGIRAGPLHCKGATNVLLIMLLNCIPQDASPMECSTDSTISTTLYLSLCQRYRQKARLGGKFIFADKQF